MHIKLIICYKDYNLSKTNGLLTIDQFVYFSRGLKNVCLILTGIIQRHRIYSVAVCNVFPLMYCRDVILRIQTTILMILSWIIYAFYSYTDRDW